MKPRTQNFALGLTAIAFLALFLATFVFLYPVLQRGGHVIEILFRHEDGMAPLKPGSAVLLGDSLEVGHVRDIELRELPDPQRKGIRSTFFVVAAQIRTDLPLYGNCDITTNQPAIGGSGYVSITNLGTSNVPLAPPLIGRPPLSFSAVLSTLSRRLLAEGGLLDELAEAANPKVESSLMYKLLASLDDINAITRELRNQASPDAQDALLHKLHRVLDDVNVATAALRTELSKGDDDALLAKTHLALTHLDEGLSEATALLKDSRPVVQDTLASVNRATRNVEQEVLPALRAELDPANPASTLGKVHLAMDRTNAALAEIQTMTSEGQRMVVLSRPVLEHMLANFLEMSEQVRMISQELLLNPSKLILPPPPEREAKLVVFRAASSFAEAATQLDEAAARLEAVLKTLPSEDQATAGDRQELQNIFDSVRGAFERFTRAEDVLWEKLK
jgi:hypothetical protein